jgi:1,4-dihydroxy-2-naphthoate octaprenyltransferase
VLYVSLIVAAPVAALVCAVDRPLAAIAVLAGVMAASPVRAVLAGVTGRELIAVLGGTGRLQLAYGALLAIGLAAG